MSVTSRTCPQCHADMPGGSAKCPQCGLGLATPLGNSGKSTVRLAAKITTATPVTPPPKSKAVAKKPGVRVRGAALAVPKKAVAATAPVAEAPERPLWVMPAVLGGCAAFLLVGVFVLVQCLTAEEDEPTPAQPIAQAPQIPEKKDPQQVKPQVRPKIDDGHKPEDFLPVEDGKDKGGRPKGGDVEHSGELPPLVREPVVNKDKPAGESLFPDIPVLAQTKYRVHEMTISKQVKPLKLGVTPSGYDNMGALLGKLGDGYKYVTVNNSDLLEPKKLADYDVLFLCCATSTSQNLKQNTTLRGFVERGGTIYASDLRLDAIYGAFPEYFAPRLPLYQGNVGPVKADVINPGLREMIGKQVPITFNAGGWKSARFQPNKVTTFLEANYRLTSGHTMTKGQIMVKFAHKKGAVIFTSFHNSAQNNQFETALLKYIVFTAVTTQVEAEIRQALTKNGFAPQDTKRHSVSAGETSTVHTYKLEKSGALQFALGLEGQGASKVRLALVTPNGEKIEHDGDSSFIFEVPDAPAGEWRYSVRAVEVPYANYPLTVTVGKKD